MFYYECGSQEVAEYLKKRWDKLNEKAKRLLNFYDPERQRVLFLVWEKQYYQQKLEEVKNEND